MFCLIFITSDLFESDGPGESRIEPNRWQVNFEKVVLHRNTYETAWGLVLDGDDTSHIPATSLDFGLSNPTVIRSITPGTPADRCEALQPGDLIMKVGDVDVTNLGPTKTSDLLRDLLARNLRDLELHVRFSTAAQPYVSSFTEQNGEKRLVVVDVERRASVCDPLRSNDQTKYPLPPIGFHHVSKIGPNQDSSPDSSQMEIPEPLVTDPVSLYTRTAPPGDTIHRLVIELPWPASVEMHNRLDNLGIRLVGSRLPEYSGTYVAGFSPGSIAEQHGDLRIGDEIIQVNQIGVAGSGRLLVGRCIANAIQQSYEHAAKDHEEENMGQFTNPTISLVIRRNPVHLELMSTLCSPERTNVPSAFDGNAIPPINEIDSRDELNVLSRPIRSPVHRLNGQVDSGEETIPLASLAGPVLNEDLTGTQIAGRVESPPLRPPRRFSKQLSPTSELIEKLPVITSDPVSLYTRTAPPGDTIHRLVIELPWPASVEMHNRLDNLGIRLVGSRLPEYSGTYVAGFSPGSIAEQHGDLRIGDEIIQVNQIGVAGSGRLLVGRCIANAIQQSYEHAAKDHEEENMGQFTNPTISLVIRRNPVHLELMSTLCSPERTNVPSAFDGNAIPPIAGPRDQYDSSDARSTDMSLLDQIASLLNEPLDNFEIFDVNIHRDKDGFGIFLVNYGPDDRPGVFVSELAPNGAASLQCKLYPHDQILAVNGSVEKDYDATFKRMKMSSSQVCLTIGRRKQPSSTGPTTQPVATSSPNPLHTSDDSPVLPALPTPVEIVPGQETLIELTRKPGNSWGFSIVGGVNTSLTAILIHSIHDDGVVASDGRLAVGDRLLAVNGIDLRNVDHETATNAIRSGGDSLKLLVYRELPTRFEDLTEPVELEVTIPRQAGQNLGLALIGRSPYSTGTAISAVREGRHSTFSQRSSFILSGHAILFLTDQSNVRQPRLPLEVETVFLQRPGELRNNSSNRRSSQPLLGWSNAEASFGLFLRQASEDEVLDAGGYLIVESILENSPAAISLKIHPGDRLLAVDREPVDWLLPDEVFELLAGLSECTLELGHLPRAPYPGTPDFVVSTPYPPVLENHQLPDVFGAEMPPIVQPAGVREMGTLEEEEDDRGPMVDLKRSRQLPEPQKEEEEEEEGELNSETASVSSTAVRDAMAKAKRAAHGFQVRQIYLPPYAPGNSLGLRLVRGTGISGTIVVDVAPGSAAALANLCVGDRVLGLDNKLLLALGPGISASKIVANIEQIWRTRTSENPVSLTVISTSQSDNELNELQDPGEHRVCTTAGTTPDVDAQATFPTLQGRVVYGPEDGIDS
ncbi:hypothetical protein AHF37_00732 [Paragonimus kellicotti]|nr:hypothetical protein AHF37_00732 [Paragonimus kellicotti]